MNQHQSEDSDVSTSERCEVSARLWSTLPHDLPADIYQRGEQPHEDVIQVDKLPSMAKMYRSIIFSRRPSLARGDALPHLAAETTLHVDAEWLSRYREICELPREGVTLPLTVPQVFAAPLHTYLLAHPSFPLSALGIVHAGNEMIASEPINAEESLTLRVWIGETRWRERGLEFDIHTTARRVGHDQTDVIWRAKTMVFRSVKSKQNARKPRDPRPAEPLLNGVETSLSLSADLGRRYAPIAGDHNPIHLYPLTARLFGFKRPIVHGMWTLARSLGEYASGLSPERSALGVGALSVKFRRPLLLPSDVTLITSPQQSEEATPSEGAKPQYFDQTSGACLQILDARGKVAIEGALRLSADQD